MKIADLGDRTKVDEIKLKITSKEEPRDVRGGTLRTCNCTGTDEDGATIQVTLWQDDVDKVKEGDTILIKGGWAQLYQDKLQVSSGRFGSLEVVQE